MSAITQAALRQRNELASIDEANFKLIEDAYALMYERLQGDIDALVLAIGDMEEGDDVEDLPQYKRLIRNTEKELEKFTTVLETLLGAAGIAALTLGLAHSAELVNLSTAGGFLGLDTAIMRTLLEYLKPDGKLYARLSELTGAAVDSVIKAIIDGVAKGLNPRTIAPLIMDAFGGGLTDALRMMRTLQLYSYREAARANYLETNGIVTGWVWFAELDADVCMSCVAMHGTIHELEEVLNDHHNGRCAPLPYIPEFGNPVEQTGEEWFNSLSPAQQKQMMGEGKFDAWQKGQFTFDKLSREVENDVYGKMRHETPLKDLVK